MPRDLIVFRSIWVIFFRSEVESADCENLKRFKGMPVNEKRSECCSVISHSPYRSILCNRFRPAMGASPPFGHESLARERSGRLCLQASICVWNQSVRAVVLSKKVTSKTHESEQSKNRPTRPSARMAATATRATCVCVRQQHHRWRPPWVFHSYAVDRRVYLIQVAKRRGRVWACLWRDDGWR